MKNPLLVPELRELLESGNIEEVIDFCNTSPPMVVADFIGALSPDEDKDILLGLKPEVRSSIFSYFDDDVKLSVIKVFENNEIADIIIRMPKEDRMNLIKLLPYAQRREIREIYRQLDNDDAMELAEDIDQLLKTGAFEEEAETAEIVKDASEILPFLQIYKLVDNKPQRIEKLDKECWINIVNPSRDNLPLIANYFNIPVDFLIASLDIDEIAHIEIEESAILMIYKVPYFDEHSDVPYFTLPIGLIIVNGILISVCARELTVLADFIQGKVKHITSINNIKWVLQIMLRSTMVYLQYLKQINNAAGMIQKTLEQESRNQQLIKLLNIEKSLVYFLASLKTNGLMLERLQKLSIIHIDNEIEGLFEDIVIENRQALEMSNIYSDILSGMMDAFASVISNNLNIVMKFLTSITIILTIPVVITSMYGMNVQLPFMNSPYAFLMIMVTSLLFAIVAVLFFIKKKWM